jgi:hypothetical protein
MEVELTLQLKDTDWLTELKNNIQLPWKVVRPPPCSCIGRTSIVIMAIFTEHDLQIHCHPQQNSNDNLQINRKSFKDSYGISKDLE